MKVMMVNHFPLEGSGSGIYTLNLAKELSSLGHDVLVIYPDHEARTYESFRGRAIIFNNGDNHDWELDFNFPCFTTHPNSHETYYHLSEEQISAYVNCFVSVVAEEAASFKPDIIHAQHLWITPYAAMKTGLPYVVTAHGTDIKGFKQDERYHPFAIEGARGSSKVITISKEVDKEVERLYGIPKGQRQLIQNGYDEQLFLPKKLERRDVLKAYGVNENCSKVVFFAGKLAHFKGVDVLLKAASHYEKKYEDQVCTIIAGNGELLGELKALKTELNLKGIHFIGHVQQESLAELFSVADVSIVPSRNEPFGLVAIEAMACGTPVVGTNQGGLPDFVREEVGQLVEVEDDLALAEAIFNELSRSDAPKRRQLCAAYAKDNFSWRKSIREVEKLYASVLKEDVEGVNV